MLFFYEYNGIYKTFQIFKRNKAGASHNTGYKTRARSNRLGQSCGVKGAKIEKRMRRLIGK